MPDHAKPPPVDTAVPLASLRPGDRAVVVGVDVPGGVGRRLLDLGFVPGTALQVIRRAPLGDPVAYEIRGSRICLRASEAQKIRVRAPRAEPAP